ncbi:LOW QUALITY PROTEIN: probable multidrug resistance-associated protein lethal(2)03659 [Zootermopsis nevadensis]|uniref:LOW QUALITY PROTEIN: probable multidrug resistance-associated protein lethal(2)03659 n=1 Tax=Zootermopsis nevadensis TaxID=136037 RepID=UPI000B8E2D01|nr:LOW QUALITY PROTEIN: probable multidrug resistance-associated protein lethal(2)03659 [Zootermopsis nevadensis]
MDASSKKREIPHPRASANPLSAITFYWLLGTFKKGFKKDLEIEDLYSTLEEHRSDYLGNKVERLWNQELEQAGGINGKPSLFKVLRRCFGLEVILIGLILAFEELLFKVTQPLFVGGFIRYFSPESNMSRNTAFMYAAAIVICSAVNVIVRQSFMMAMFHLGMKIRVSLCSLLYRKDRNHVTCTSNAFLQVVCSFPRQSQRFVFVLTIVMTLTENNETSVNFIRLHLVNCVFFNLSAYFGKLLSTFRLRTAKRTDERVRFMNEIIVGIQVIKMYAWEKPFAYLVSVARRNEIQTVRAALYVRGLLLLIGKFSTKIAIFIAIVSYALLGNKITAEKVRDFCVYGKQIILGCMIFSILGVLCGDCGVQVSVVRIPSLLHFAFSTALYMCCSLLNRHWSLSHDIWKYGNAKTVMARGSAGPNILLKDPQSMFLSQEVVLHQEQGIMMKWMIIPQNHYHQQRFLLYGEVTTATRCIANDMKTTDLICDKSRPLGNECKMEMAKTGALEFSVYAEENSTDSGDTPDKKGLKVTNVMARWTEDLPENTLTDVSLEVRPGGLVAVIGPVGSGKTSLVHAVLKELPLISGSILVGESVSYASQEPWLFTASVRQNILFGQLMDRNRYRQVVRACALERDFQLLPHGDMTIVGERDVTLSGGQKARINLARAIYKQPDLYILDDPLSAVDAHVGRHLFDDCICNFLHGKTRVLVTHQLQYLQTVDKIVILNNGMVEATGTYAELHNSGLNFAKQLGLETDTENNQEKHHSDSKPSIPSHSNLQLSLRSTKRQISETSEHSSLEEPEPKQVAEMQTRGRVKSGVYGAYCAAGGNWFITSLMLSVFVLAQLVVSVGDYWMSFWTNVEERRSLDINGIASNITGSVINYTATQFLGMDVATVTPTNITEWNWIFNTTITPVNDTEWSWMPSTETCIFVYTGLVIGIIVLSLASTFFFFSMCMTASINLHNSMFSSISRATVWFFNNNPSGQILNRFTKDMGAIDEVLPQTMMDCVQRTLMILGVIVVVAVVNYWMLIPTVLMLVLFFMLRIYYIATSRSIKRLEGVTRSPVFSHLNASLQGLTTIRAFSAEALLEKEFDTHQDLHSTSHYLFIAANRAFGLWLDGLCVIYIGLVTFSFLMLNGVQYGGDVGLAITQAIGLTGMLQWGIRQMAEMENQMTSVERVLEYTAVQSEPPLETPPSKKPPKDWPAMGTIVFDRVFLSYTNNEPPVLKNISFSIRPAEKIGIVGRTGAGKSSLITALFRLVDPSSGLIHIDGVNTILIGLHDLRSRISIIPQEPALFSGLLRENLDPFGEFRDAVLWAALAEVELKQVVDELPAGLNHRVSEGGSNFSVGQRQLLCLARAIIRNNKILVLDEATANVDPKTDELIQATIRHKFINCTVLTIAHRLCTVIDSNRILVMDAGSVVEFDHPYLLLKNENGYLYQMVQQSGHAMADSLFRAAQMNFESLDKKT